MIQDTTIQEDLKSKLAQEEIRKIQIQNNVKKKKGNKLETGLKVGKGIYKAIERM